MKHGIRKQSAKQGGIQRFFFDSIRAARCFPPPAAGNMAAVRPMQRIGNRARFLGQKQGRLKKYDAKAKPLYPFVSHCRLPSFSS
jgi:hypothetical protein